MGLKNKTALVTGSTKGIGKAIAIELAKEGVHVLINGRNEEEAERTVNEIKSAFPDTFPQNAAADIVDIRQREALFKKHPQIDILVNNMGIYELMQYEDIAAAPGFCPPGCHIPVENEWNTLFNLYISSGFAGAPLKYSGYSGFNALLGGLRFKYKSWGMDNFATLIWSSSSYGPEKAWAHGMNSFNPSVSFYPASRSNAFVVRCVQN